LEWFKTLLAQLQRGIHSIIESQTSQTVEIRQDIYSLAELIKRNFQKTTMENSALSSAVAAVAAAVTLLSTDLQSVIDGLNAKDAALQTALTNANAQLNTLQLKGRPEDADTITALRQQLDNISVGNDPTDAISALNDIATKLSTLDASAKSATPTDAVTPPVDPPTTVSTPTDPSGSPVTPSTGTDSGSTTGSSDSTPTVS
jgi:hypothetical protein